MKPIVRLTRSCEIMRVRRLGKSHAHPLLILIIAPIPGQENSQVAVIAGKAVGNAVQRNRAKRRLRSAIQTLQTEINSGFDIVIIARHDIAAASFQDIVNALRQTGQRSGLMN